MLAHLQVQSKVNLKYDSWHKEVLSKFGQMLGSNMTEFHSQISKVRKWGPGHTGPHWLPRLQGKHSVLSNSLAKSWSSTQWTRPAPQTQ